MASITKRVLKDGSVTYRLRACVGRDASDSQVWRTCTISSPGLTPKKEKDAVELLAAEWEKSEREKYEKSPTKHDKTKITVKAFIETVWLPVHVRNGKHSPNSVKFYENTSKVIVDYFGDKKLLKQIDVEDCHRFVTYLNTEALSDRGELFSETSRMHIFGTLRNVLRIARRFKYIPVDPTEDMDRNARPHREKKAVEYLNKDEAQQFRKALEAEPLNKRAYFTLLLLTGMRRGEAVALTWSDIDEEKKTVSISKNVVVDKNSPNGRQIKGTKTDEPRIVHIPDNMLVLLKQLRMEQEKNIGAKLMPNAYIFSLAEDPFTCIFPSTPTRWMEQIVKKHHLKKCSVHSLRRTFATIAQQNNVDTKTVQTVLGHSDVGTTLKYYTGTDDDKQREAVELMDEWSKIG